ncbi:MAG: hypothetical protein HY816_05220 [Candidatus Wallbacteria bacterium]|nr:hypothetical protein [Candidatus Wallbacteria bacterium]
MRGVVVLAALACGLAVGSCWAVWPLVWQKSSQSAFEPGRLDHLSLSDAGEIALLPETALQLDAEGESFVWSLAESRQGEIYAGTGPRGKVFRRGADGKWTLALETGEVAVTALAAAPDGSVYAGTIPGGRIFRIAASGFQVGPAIETGERYVWALRALPGGELVAATGSRARLLKYSDPGSIPPSKPDVMLESEEDHLLCVMRMPDGTLLAGSAGHGLLYAIPLAGPTTVLFDAPQEEIRALARDGDVVYAAAQTGPHVFPSSRPAPASASQPAGTVGPPPAAPRTAAPQGAATTSSAHPERPDRSAPPRVPTAEPPALPKTPPPPPAPPRAPVRFARVGPNLSQAVFAILPSGVAQQVFTSDQDVLLSLVAMTDGGVAVGTGQSGQCFLISREGRLTRWVHLEEGQALAFLRTQAGELLVGAGNPARVRSLGPRLATTGTLTTEALDAGGPARWGVISWRLRGEGLARVSSRSGNSERPDATWSAWSSPAATAAGSAIESPPGRYLQAKVELRATPGQASPVLESLRMAYLPANAPPSVDSLEISSPAVDLYGEHREPSQRERDKQAELMKKRPPPGMRRVKWEASDPNRDRLSTQLYLRESREKAWRPLLDGPTGSNEYEWDVRNLPDGAYRVKAVVTDAWSNPPGTERSASRESDLLVIDTGPPVLSPLAVASASGTVTVKTSAEDSTGVVLTFEYALDGADWTPAAPKDGFADSRREELELSLGGLSPGEHTLAVRARDDSGNAALARIVFEAKP